MNTKLQNELKAATDANKQIERKNAAILENHSTLKGLLYLAAERVYLCQIKNLKSSSNYFACWSTSWFLNFG